jgi:hypothetical protein
MRVHIRATLFYKILSKDALVKDLIGKDNKMNRLSTEKRAMILRCLVEGNSIRSTVRITGATKNTVLKLLVDAGKACAEYQNKTLRNLTCKRLQVDEIWSFCYAKQKNVPKEFKNQFGYGDVWTFSAIVPTPN